MTHYRAAWAAAESVFMRMAGVGVSRDCAAGTCFPDGSRSIMPTRTSLTPDLAIADELLLGTTFGARTERWIETHAAVVFLTADRAWKLKRPVRYAYLDFTTLARRHAALVAELALNRDLAPDLYLGVHAITRAADGTLRLGGDGAVVDWVLEMRRFADGGLLSEVVGRQPIDPAMLTRLVDRLVAFHARAAACEGTGGAARLAAVIDGNARAMAQYPATLPPARVTRLQLRLQRALARHGALLEARGAAGRIRQGHGDLHLGNITIIDGEAVAFDRLEFSRELATGDVLYDLGFMIMDCWHRGLRREANLICNRYLDLSAADEEAACLVPLFMAVRASVRAHVAATRAEQDGDAGAAVAARRYLALALACLRGAPARLIAIGGASGTGKSTLARAIADRIGAVPGARILRTDMLRKRAAGLAPEVPLPASAYTGAATDGVYAALATAAGWAIAGGTTVIADATFLDARQRAVVEVAGGRRFHGLWLQAPQPVRIARVGARRNDASDADVAVAAAQAAPASPPSWHCLDAGGDIPALADAALGALRLPMQRSGGWAEAGR
jgi:aminoglycoside phosphotransferase family enzyme/predicted kinase